MVSKKKDDNIPTLADNNVGFAGAFFITRIAHSGDTIRVPISGGYLKTSEYSYTLIIVWVSTILDHIDTMIVPPKYEGALIILLIKFEML